MYSGGFGRQKLWYLVEFLCVQRQDLQKRMMRNSASSPVIYTQQGPTMDRNTAALYLKGPNLPTVIP